MSPPPIGMHGLPVAAGAEFLVLFSNWIAGLWPGQLSISPPPIGKQPGISLSAIGEASSLASVRRWDIGPAKEREESRKIELRKCGNCMVSDWVNHVAGQEISPINDCGWEDPGDKYSCAVE